MEIYSVVNRDSWIQLFDQHHSTSTMPNVYFSLGKYLITTLLIRVLYRGATPSEPQFLL